MIFALIKAQTISLLRDRMAMALSFALPCVMFSVFAVIFGGIGKSAPQPLQILVTDQDGSKSSQRMINALRAMDQIMVRTVQDLATESGSNKISDSEPMNDRDQAVAAVQKGKVAAAVIFPQGLEDSFANFGQLDRPSIELIYDPSNLMAEQMLVGVLQASAFTSSPEMLIDKGLEQFRQFGGSFTPLQEVAVQAMKAAVSSTSNVLGEDKDSAKAPGLSMSDGIVRITSISARDIGKNTSTTQTDGTRMISYYAAGISVMFIMFSMSSASSSLLEHQERGTLERLLSGRMTMLHLLASHWIFYAMLGVVQISLMFVFAAVFFRLDLWHAETVLGAGIMAIVSSMASAAFIMMIATLCRSRKQLEGLSTIVILIMSAVGGSMMPRFIMPSFVLKLSSVAFNAWSMDGFLKVFWYNTPDTSIIASILPEVAVILGMAAVFLTVAGLNAKKWIEQ